MKLTGVGLTSSRATFWALFCLLTVYVLFVWHVLIGELPVVMQRFQKVDNGALAAKRTLYKKSGILEIWKTSSTEEMCRPKKHVLFVKVPKCGSSTLSSIFLRYGFRYSLDVALPLNNEFNLNSLLNSLNSSAEKRDIFASHVTYDVIKQHKHLIPKNALYITIIREPLGAFKSFFNFRHKGSDFGIEGEDQIRNFFANSTLYSSPASSKFWNRMVRYLGYKPPPSNSSQEAEKAALQYVRLLDREFDFVVILEYFEESLILLRRMLCWATHDMLYTQQKPGSSFSEYYKSSHTANPVVVQKHRELSYADYILYDYFKLKTEKLIESQDDDFFNEVRNFKTVNGKVTRFCQNKTARNRDETLKMAPTRWSSGFTLRREYCHLLAIDANRYSILLKKGKFLEFRL
ncbi:galactose-3-O-sulfotransferase 3 [Lingula anatina]|uniref:Galactose-3-O-sulfotransferase 3 n=1 Tax=Lingula anatina TaxID=7574 RepID=A0A1S3JD50_LINAN|nr:galactose-3-O-sulfotransferase 3 [Lingula anatina]|eukprot:XP_013407814.1 galactose-3-O-sulfotransferase 3 [Lingula anatina]